MDDNPIVIDLTSAWDEIRFFLIDILDDTIYIDFIGEDVEISMYQIILSALILITLSEAFFKFNHSCDNLDDD